MNSLRTKEIIFGRDGRIIVKKLWRETAVNLGMVARGCAALIKKNMIYVYRVLCFSYHTTIVVFWHNTINISCVFIYLYQVGKCIVITK